MGGPCWGLQGAETRGAHEPRCVDSGRAWWRPRSAPRVAGRLGSPAPSPRPHGPYLLGPPNSPAWPQSGGWEVTLPKVKPLVRRRPGIRPGGPRSGGALLPGEPRPALGQPPRSPVSRISEHRTSGRGRGGCPGVLGSYLQGREGAAEPHKRLGTPGPKVRAAWPASPKALHRPCGSQLMYFKGKKKIIKEVRTMERP